MPTLEEVSDYSVVDWSLVPEHCRDGLRRYLEHGKVPGHFLTALLRNDLRETCARADHVNLQRLGDYVKFLYNFAPRDSWGSPENFDAWVARGGLGQAEAA
ncbi:MAG: hypothetical protein E6G97_02000 [Alphaproteobacteria bacterium]|nr:MAG: hypothetical protein E6G97_02000 [Alphaproteobacteria bacterium]